MDSLQRLFDDHCDAATGSIIREEEWLGLIATLKDSGLVVEPHEIHFLNSLWAAKTSQAEWHHGKETTPSISFNQLHDAIVKDFGGLLHGSGEVESNLALMGDEVEALSVLVQGWDVPRCDESETLKLLSLVEGLEGSFARSSSQAARLVDRQASLSLCHQLRVLVHDRLDSAPATTAAGQTGTLTSSSGGDANPWVWQRAHSALLEAQIQRRKVRNLRPVPGGVEDRRDPMGLGGGQSHFLGTSIATKKRGEGGASLGGGSGKRVPSGTRGGGVDVDLNLVEVQRSTSACEKAWAVYAFYRELALSPFFLDTVAVDDTGADSTRFLYEFAPSVSLKALLHESSSRGKKRGGVGGGGGVVLGESSPLLLHWLRSSLRGLADLEKCSTFTPSSAAGSLGSCFGLGSVFVSSHGSVVRLGKFPALNSMLDASSSSSSASSSASIAGAVEHRSKALLLSWADMVDDLFATLCSSFSASASDSELENEEARDTQRRRGGEDKDKKGVRTFSSSEAFAGIYLNPGDRFEVSLDSLGREDSVWHASPEVVSLAGGTGPCVELMDDEELLRATTSQQQQQQHEGSSGGAGVTRASGRALRPGRCELRFFCHPRSGPRPPEPALVVPVVVRGARMSPALSAILTCCRAGGPSSQEGAFSRNFPLSVGMLCTHDYFATPPDIEEVMSVYSQHF